MIPQCPYDGNEVFLDSNHGDWYVYHCPACGNEWTTRGIATGDSTRPKLIFD